MLRGIRTYLIDRLTRWLNRERPLVDVPPSDFERLCYEIRPCDVLLVEGRTRVSDVIKSITLSNWTHAALYIGRLHDIDSPEMRARLRANYAADADEQLIIEAVLGEGTIVSPLSRYRQDHIRICRPSELRRRDAQAVMHYCIARLGHQYDVRHLFDLARFLLPYGFLPRRWRSSLFVHSSTASARTICSTLLAGAFASVRYPVLPVLRRNGEDQVHLQNRNLRLLIPRDFDYSPYFDVIKYPVMAFDDLAIYHRMPWDPDTVYADAPGEEVVVPTNDADTTDATRLSAYGEEADSVGTESTDSIESVHADESSDAERGADGETTDETTNVSGR